MKRLFKVFSLLLLCSTLLINPCYSNAASAIQNLKNEKYITSYNCKEGTTTTVSLSQVIQNAESTEENILEAPASDENSEETIKNEISPRIVFDEDEWRESNPYDPKVAYISVYWKDGGSNTRATAFFISNDTVVTSAHCIYKADRGGWCDYADIFPAKNGDDNPYGQISSHTIHLLTDYMNSPSTETDYAIIELESATNFGYFGWNTSATVGQSIKIVGYPSYLSNNPSSGTKKIKKQYYDTGTISAVYTSSIRTTNTNTNDGNSGGPVLNSNNQVIGILKGSSGTSYNFATRIGADEAEWFATFR